MDFTNLAHVHLLLNHFPTIGFAVGFSLFIGSFVRKSEELKRASLVVLFLIALLAIPTYISGNAAQDVIKERPGVSRVKIQEHEGAALLAFAFMELTGFVAWLELWQFRRAKHFTGMNSVVALSLSLVTFLLMARAANMGGEIRHPEIAAAGEAAAAGQAPAPAPAEEQLGDQQPGVGLARTIGSFVIGNKWVWPTCETLHFVGLCMLFAVVLVVDLRMLGMGKSLSFSSLYQLLPLGMLGFGLNLATGMMFFVGTPGQYTGNIAFFWKMVMVVLAGINVLYFILFEEPWKVGVGDNAPLRAKFIAASAIFLWLGVLYFGHMLPFIGNAF